MFRTLTGLLTLTTTFGAAPVSTSYVQPQVEIITDFAGNEFLLFEGENSYEIHTYDNIFIEGSYSSNSPYYETEGAKYYLGPSNYYVENDGLVTDISNDRISSINQYYGYSYSINPIVQSRSSTPTPDSTRTYVDSNGYTVVKEAEYFKNLKKFPQNWFGECGVIALSELLGYYDTFYNDDFIPNDLTYDARYYVEKENLTRGNSDSNLELERTEVEPLTSPAKVSYKNTDYYDFEEWNEMPGTTYAMRDYIFDNYMHTYLGIGSDDGYPMLDGELNSTLEEYMEKNCSHLLDDVDFKHYSIINTHKKPKEFISQGFPTLLVLQEYESNIGNGNDHVVLAYGYSGDNFLTHFGWWPGTKGSAEVVISSATIYGYFTMKYTGEHKHSSNVSMTYGNTTKYICGCGKVHESHYSICPEKFGFDSRYYFENEGLKCNSLSIDNLTIQTERLRCGYIEDEYINLSPNRKNAGYAYLNLNFNENIYQINTNLTFWSSNEGLSTSSGDYAYIKYLDSSGNWQILLDLLNCDLSTNRSNPDFFKLEIPNGTKQIRFEAYKESPTTSRNKGRICIGDTTFITRNN